MNDKTKLALVTMILTLFSVQGHAAGFLKFDGVKGESQAHHDEKHNNWIDVESVSWSREQAMERNNRAGPARIHAQSETMGWDNVRNKAADDRPTEDVSFYYTRIRSVPEASGSRPAAPDKPQPAALLVPAVQKAR